MQQGSGGRGADVRADARERVGGKGFDLGGKKREFDLILSWLLLLSLHKSNFFCGDKILALEQI
jgi:hypothetical protein